YGAIAGGINTLLYFVFTRYLHITTVIATSLAWLFANLFSYYMNQIFVFKIQKRHILAELIFPQRTDVRFGAAIVADLRHHSRRAFGDPVVIRPAYCPAGIFVRAIVFRSAFFRTAFFRAAFVGFRKIHLRAFVFRLVRTVQKEKHRAQRERGDEYERCDEYRCLFHILPFPFLTRGGRCARRYLFIHYSISRRGFQESAAFRG
ncbi:MAG: GtrA family protein, partial [Clostridia bacterium]|nr:GtrA family protein [Clostridia bacterium]